MMETVSNFFLNLGLGPIFFYPLVLTLVAVMAWFAYEETRDTPEPVGEEPRRIDQSKI